MSGPAWRKAAWFVGIWVASVGVLTLVAMVIRAAIT